VNKVTLLRIPIIAGNLLISWKIISFCFELHELLREEIHIHFTVLYIIINIINVQISPVMFKAITYNTSHVRVI
jgi:hypothetical protein